MAIDTAVVIALVVLVVLSAFQAVQLSGLSGMANAKASSVLQTQTAGSIAQQPENSANAPVRTSTPTMVGGC